MRLSLDFDASHNIIRAYGEGFVTVNADTRVERSCVITPERLLTEELPASFDALEATHFEALLEHAPELVLLGTGRRQRFPHPRLTRALLEKGIGVEAMDTAAACRTYNIVVAEGRRVAALLLMI